MRSTERARDCTRGLAHASSAAHHRRRYQRAQVRSLEELVDLIGGLLSTVTHLSRDEIPDTCEKGLVP